MWGSFMEKAKDLAVNLDKQINESVGLEVESTPATTNSTSESEAKSGDAWNDDFDFEEEQQEVQVQGQAEEPLPPVQSQNQEMELNKGNEISVTPPEPVESMTDFEDAERIMETPVPDQSAESVDMIQPAAPPSSEEVASPEGWDAGDEDIEIPEDEEGPEEYLVTESSSKEDKPSLQQESFQPQPRQESLPESPREETTPPFPSEPSPSTKHVPIFASGMLSSLAHRAEAIAHQAESFVQLPSHRMEATKPVSSGAISSLLSAFPITSVSSSKLQETASATATASGWNEDGDEDLHFDDDEDSGDQKNEEKHNEEMKKVEASPSVELEGTVQVDGPTNTPEEVITVTSPVRSVAVELIDADTIPGHPMTSEPTPVIAANNIEEDPRYRQLLQQLQLREQQLSNKSNQLTQLQELMEQQERELNKKINETKEEAKKRIMRAKERCDAAEAKVQQLQSVSSADAASQSQLIQALREEGEKLAHKQSAMEQAVRAAKLESRELAEHLTVETNAKKEALAKITQLESDLKTTKEFLTAARKGESQAGKLEQDLLTARSDAELKAATILSLQQQIKELNAEGKELQEELKRTRKEAQQAAQLEKKTLRQEHHDMINDLETKLRTTEREAAVREDALRHEVSELRKRWQDAVRRADALSMDVQSSTAPLLRQLESMERQNRARAANWAELESRLRSELEETVIQNETLTKERSEFKTKYTRLERSIVEQEQDLKQSKRIIEEQTSKISKLESQLTEMEAQAQKREEEYTKVERLANEGVMRVRSEMTQTVVDSEERYRGQIDKLEKELRVENEKRSQLEKQVEQLLENAGMFVAPQATETIRLESKPKKLRQAEGQAQILAGALGFDSDTDDDDDDGEIFGHGMDRGEVPGNAMNSFAALEQLTSKLKAAKIELEALRRNLRESEHVRESLVEELGESRVAKEKLPLFEAKVKELTQENREKELEIQGLREDIADVREMYRTQLNLLLEEKAATHGPQSNGTSEAHSFTSEVEVTQPSD